MTRSIMGLALALASVAGCKWTDFDDLAEQTWVKSTEKPTNDASDYGIAVQRGLRVGSDGGTLVVLGTGQALYTELVYDSKGNSSLASNQVKLNNEDGIASLVDQPLLIADPESDDVSLVVASGQNSVAVLTGTGMLNVQQVFGQNSPDGATYLKFDAAQRTKPIVGAGSSVFGVDTDNAANMHTCALTDAAAAPIQIAALGASKVNASDMTETLVVWTKSGQLLLYDPAVWNGTTAAPCTATTPLAAAVDTAFMPGTGAQVFTLHDTAGKDSTQIILAARQAGSGGAPNGNASTIQMFDLASGTPVAVGSPIGKEGLHGTSVASFDGGHSEVFIAGYPNDTAGSVEAGQVLVYPITATGINPTPLVTLSDAQPDAGQQFGRAVTAMPFNGSNALIVAASNEIYAYVELDQLYGDLRQ